MHTFECVCVCVSHRNKFCRLFFLFSAHIFATRALCVVFCVFFRVIDGVICRQIHTYIYTCMYNTCFAHTHILSRTFFLPVVFLHCCRVFFGINMRAYICTHAYLYCIYIYVLCMHTLTHKKNEKKG